MSNPPPLVRNVFFFFSFLHPIYFPRTTLALPPSSSSDPGSHSGPSSPLPTTVRAFRFFIARTIQYFLPPSTRVELCVRYVVVRTHARPRAQPGLLLVADDALINHHYF